MRNRHGLDPVVAGTALAAAGLLAFVAAAAWAGQSAAGALLVVYLILNSAGALAYLVGRNSRRDRPSGPIGQPDLEDLQ